MRISELYMFTAEVPCLLRKKTHGLLSSKQAIESVVDDIRLYTKAEYVSMLQNSSSYVLRVQKEKKMYIYKTLANMYWILSEIRIL